MVLDKRSHLTSNDARNTPLPSVPAEDLPVNKQTQLIDNTHADNTPTVIYHHSESSL